MDLKDKKFFWTKCNRNNYGKFISIEAELTFDLETGNSIVEIMKDALNNGGETKLGNLEEAVMRYCEIYYKWYDVAYHTLLDLDTSKIARGLPTRAQRMKEFKLNMIQEVGKSRRDTDDEELDKFVEEFLDDTVDYDEDDEINDNISFLEREYLEELFSNIRFYRLRPGIMMQNRFCQRKRENGYVDGQVMALLNAYCDGIISDFDSKEETDKFIEKLTEAGLLTPAGEETKKMHMKRYNRFITEENKN